MINTISQKIENNSNNIENISKNDINSKVNNEDSSSISSTESDYSMDENRNYARSITVYNEDIKTNEKKIEEHTNSVEYSKKNVSKNISNYSDKYQWNSESGSATNSSVDEDLHYHKNLTKNINIVKIQKISEPANNVKCLDKLKNTSEKTIEKSNNNVKCLDKLKNTNEKAIVESNNNVKYGDKSNLNTNRIDNVNNFGEILEYSNENLAKLIRSIKN